MQRVAMTIGEIDLKTYAAFLADARGGTVFHSPGWLASLRRGFGVRTAMVGVFDGDTLYAVCPWVERGPGFLRVAGSPLPRTLTPYQGPVFASGCSPEVRSQALRALLQRNRAIYVRFDWPPTEAQLPADLPIEPAYTAMIDLTVGEKALFENMKGETRSQVRQAYRRGVEVKFLFDGGEWVGDYMALSRSTYARQGLSPVISETFLHSLFEECKGSIGAAVAVVDGDMVAAGLFVYDGVTAYFLDNVSRRDAQQYRGNNAVVWEIMRWGTTHGHQVFDLVGANIPSIAAFKFGFGARRETFPTLTQVSAVGKLAYSGFRTVRRLAQRIRRGLSRR